MAFNIQGAVQSLIARSTAKTRHQCAKYVRMAMESGGLSTATRPDWAWKYIQWLPTQGWSHIGTVNTNEAQAEFTRSQARAGDVAVYQKPGLGTSHPGHICMYTGSQWVSDFRQNRMGVYPSPVNAYIFRYTGEISNAPISIEGLGEYGDGGTGGSGLDFSGGFSELNTETLAAKCPDHIDFKGMWMRYQLRLGLHSPIIQQFQGSPSDGPDDPAWNGAVRTEGFAPMPYPFANVPPFKGISSYDLRNLRFKPALTYQDLAKNPNSPGPAQRTTNPIPGGWASGGQGTAGGRKNNPCNISHSAGDIGYVGSSKVADGQDHAAYQTVEAGIASAMRLLKRKYANKSIHGINVTGFQGYYSASEEIGLSACRIVWITNTAARLGIDPFAELDLEDANTLKWLTRIIASQETGMTLGADVLDQAYKMAFG